MAKQKTLSNKEIRTFLSQLPSEFSQKVPKKGLFLIKEFDKTTILFIDKKPYFFKVDDIWIPTLFALKDLNLNLKKVVVDKGAIPYLVNGADVMRPGITSVDNFSQDEIVQIIDENNQVAIVIGRALFDSEKIKTMSSGKVVRNLHYVGDLIWKQNQ